MLYSPRFTVAALLVLAIASPLNANAGAASTFNITGTWTGGYSCKGIDAGAKTKLTVKPATMTITQVNDVAALMHIEAAGAGGGSHTYNGNVSASADKPGTGAATSESCEPRTKPSTMPSVLPMLGSTTGAATTTTTSCKRAS